MFLLNKVDAKLSELDGECECGEVAPLDPETVSKANSFAESKEKLTSLSQGLS